VVDAPTSFPTPSGWYTPHDYEAGYAGAMTLTSAFETSRNIPALKLAAKVGIKTVIAMAHRFGITSEIPPFLPIAIGAADITLAEQVGAYTVFPNDGIRIQPHYIRKVTQPDGVPLDAKKPTVTEVISVDVARSMMILLKAVVTHGTGAEATAVLKHPLGGKTGTTNDFTDAWFIGFSPSVTCGTWIGFDNRQTLGKGEQGAKAALPMWIDFMKAAIVGKDDEQFPSAGAPKKVLAVQVNSDANSDDAPKKSGDQDDDADAADGDATPKQSAPIVRQPPPDATLPSAPSSSPKAPLPQAPPQR
jgi:penicillin-binding protein 1A